MIIAPPHMDITLTFLTFDLENDPLLVGEGDCKYDWLDVWDGLPQGEGTHTHTNDTHAEVEITQLDTSIHTLDRILIHSLIKVHGNPHA